VSQQKFDYLNLTLRGLVVISKALRKGYVTNQDVRELYSLHKRSKRGENFLRNMVSEGYLKRAGYDKYVLTEKAYDALNTLYSIFETGQRNRILVVDNNASL